MIENSLSPLYRGTDFSTPAETFQTVRGGEGWANGMEDNAFIIKYIAHPPPVRSNGEESMVFN